MEPETAIRIGRDALLLAVILSSLPVLAAMVIGLVVALVQAATQIQEQTLAQVPKIVVMYGVLMAAGMWMLVQLIDFARNMLSMISIVRA
jgi:flagellar biosynthesis protein FliQ